MHGENLKLNLLLCLQRHAVRLSPDEAVIYSAYTVSVKSNQ